MTIRGGEASAAPEATSDTAKPRKELHVEPIRRLALRPIEAAAALGISERLLWTRTAKGEIPCVKLGTTTLYPVRAVEEWLLEAAKESSR